MKGTFSTGAVRTKSRIDGRRLNTYCTTICFHMKNARSRITWWLGGNIVLRALEFGHCRRLLWVGRDRTEETLHSFFDLYGELITPTLKYVCSDMWKAYLKVLRERAGDAVHILDRYHVMAMMNKAIDKVRAGEAKRLKTDGYEPVLKHSRWRLLKRKST